ncbi:MAG: YncE family protein [Isosphaeraceae bacterium]
MTGLRALVAVVVAVILAGCGQAATGGVGTTPDLKLYEAVSNQSSQSISIVDSRTHAVERRLPFGTPSSDWTHLYWIKGTELIDTDPRNGKQLNSIQLPADYQLPPATISGMPGGLSQDDRWLVLESWDQHASQRPTATSLVVMDTSFTSTPVQIQLQGWFQFDAVSNDGARLYLIEYVTDTDYRVRLYQVKERLLDPSVVVDKTDPQESMAGTRLMGVPSRDGQWLYSVYARANDGPFIHALNVEGSFAFCIDLPGTGYSSDATALDWSLALSADRSKVYAANSAMGLVSEMDTSELALSRTAHIDASTVSARSWIPNVDAKELGANASVLSPDGKTLVNAAASGIVLVDTSTLKVRARALNGRHVWSLGMSPAGSTVYALDDAGTIAVVSLSTGTVMSSFDPAAGHPMAIMRVTAA